MIEKSEYLDKIINEVEAEFPGDTALQQVHLARKLLAREAEDKGLSLIEFIRLQRKERMINTAPA